jgi:D-3-phosphoglycerate dehydrogenase
MPRRETPDRLNGGPIILVAEAQDFSPAAATVLQKVGSVRLRDLSFGELLREVVDVDVLWVRLRHRIDREVFQSAGRLRYIVTPTTGLNHIDLAEAEARGVRVLSLRDEGLALRDIRATAEHTVGLILALLRSLPDAVAHVHRGAWDRDLFKGYEIYGKTIGIVGYGRLGRLVARYVAAFEARILVTDPNVKAREVEAGIELVTLEALLSQSDIVTLHVSYRPSTERFFGERQFALMKRGSWFINTSRGEVVDEAALLQALPSGRVQGAALDVLTHEHLREFEARPLVRYAREHPNLLITPHVGGCTFESMGKTEHLMAKRLADVLRPHHVAQRNDSDSLNPGH